MAVDDEEKEAEEAMAGVELSGARVWIGAEGVRACVLVRVERGRDGWLVAAEGEKGRVSGMPEGYPAACASVSCFASACKINTNSLRATERIRYMNRLFLKADEVGGKVPMTTVDERRLAPRPCLFVDLLQTITIPSCP